MKASFFILSFLAAFATAGGVTGGYERMFLWNAYRISVAANGVEPDKEKNHSGNQIAKNCRGAGGKKIPCNFNEFIAFIDNKELKTFVSPENDLPDVDATAKIIGTKERPTIDGKRVVVGATGYGSAMKEVCKIVHKARVIKKGEVDAEFVRANYAMDKVTGLRQKDMDKYRLKDFKSKFEPDLKIQTEEVTFNGNKYNRYDPNETLKNEENQKKDPKLKEKLEGFTNEYFAKNYQTKGKGKRGVPAGHIASLNNALEAKRLSNMALTCPE